MITTIQPQTAEISTVDALWVLIQSQTKAVRKALTKRMLAEEEKTKAQQRMVKESLTRAFDELHSGKIHKDARCLFADE
jgi:ATP-dependent DNA ligase